MVGKLPHVRVNPGEGGESGRPDPYVDEAVRVGMWNPRVATISVPKVLLHSTILSSLGVSSVLSTYPIVFIFEKISLDARLFTSLFHIGHPILI